MQLKHREDMTTASTRLAAGVKPIDHDDLTSTTLGFVLELAPQFAKIHVIDCPGQKMISKHAANIQIFNANRVEVPSEVGGKLVQTIVTDIGDPLV